MRRETLTGRRPLFNFAAAASLVLAVALHLVWMRGLFVQDRMTFVIGKQPYLLTTLPHQVRVEPIAAWQVQPGNNFIGGGQYGPGPDRLVPRLERTTAGSWSVSIPYWLPQLCTLVLPVRWVLRKRRARFDLQRGLCGVCGYDLRATRERCPECGAVAGPARTAASPADAPDRAGGIVSVG